MKGSIDEVKEKRTTGEKVGLKNTDLKIVMLQK